MRTALRPILAGACILCALLPVPHVTFAQTGVSAGGVSTEEGWHVLLSVPHEADGQPVVGFELVAAGAAEVGHTPEGWAAESSGTGLRFTGPPLGEDEGRFRLDIPTDEYWEGAQIRLFGPEGEIMSGPVVPPSEYPELEVFADASAFLLAPAKASVGELITLEITDEELVGIGTWRLSGTPILAIADSERMQARVPLFLQPGDYAGITWENEFGLEVINDGEAIEITGSSDEADDQPPSLTGCTPRVFVGRVACICGNFPTAEIQGGLAISGRALGAPNAASSQVVYVTIPDDLSPGRHTITGAGIEGSIEIVVLAARGEIDLSLIESGQSTPLRVIVEGTTDPLPLRLENRNPDVIRLEGGDEQTVMTTGGAVNSFERTVTGLQVGAFDVYFELAEDPCPCIESEVKIAENDLGQTQTHDDGEQDSTRVRPPWWPPPEEDDGDDPRDILPPVIYGEEEEDEEPLCCGFRGPLIVWPQTTDPLAQADPMVAPHSPAVGGNQVHLATGAYFHNDRDFGYDAVGLPLDFTRHYTSDLETLSGGVIGHKWDFNYNKRLVALGRDYADGLRGQMAGTEQSVVMYFDGMGRVLRYVEQNSDPRTVNNFAASFRAYVTTYTSPAGEFNELQRYVIEDPSAHPFLPHPDIDSGESIFYVLREKNGIRYVFNCRGQLLHILARNDLASMPEGEGNEKVRFTFKYQGDRNPLTQSTMLSSIEDPSGHFIGVKTVNIDDALVNTNDDGVHVTGSFPIPRIKTLTGAEIEVEFTYKGDDDEPVFEKLKKTFKAFAKPEVSVETHYVYDEEHRLEMVIAPEEVEGGQEGYITNKYDGQGRVESQTLAGKPYATFAYAGDVVTVTEPGNGSVRYQLEPKGDYKVLQTETRRDGGDSWTTVYAHNDDTQVTSITLPRGNKITFEYDTANAPVTKGGIRNDDQPSVTYNSDLSKGNLLRIKREAGSIDVGDGPKEIFVRHEYEPLFNQPSKLVDAEGNETTYRFEYDTQGVLGNAVEEKGPDITQADGSVVTTNPVRYEYTDRGQLESEAYNLSDVTTYTYDDRGYLTGIASPSSGSQTYGRDLYGRAQTWAGPNGTIRYEYDARGLVVGEREDPNGFDNRKRYVYDMNGNLDSVVVTVHDNFRSGESLGGGMSAPNVARSYTVATAFSQDLIGRPLTETTSGGGLTFGITRVYDAFGRVSTATEPSPTGGRLTTTSTYDGRGLPTRETAGGVVRSYEYDPNGNLVRITEGEGDTTRVHRFSYDAFDREVSRTTPLGTVTEYTLDKNGNILTEETRGPNGAQEEKTVKLKKTEYAFNELDLPTSITQHVLDSDSTKQTGQFFYDLRGNVVRAVSPGNSERRLRYDDFSRVIEETDPEGNSVRTEYDAAGRVAAIVEVEQERSYDVRTRDMKTTPKEYRSTLSYDVLGRVVTSVTSGITSAYRYDNWGRRRVAGVQHLGVTETQYDALGRQSKVLFGGREQTFKHTPAGQIAEQQGPNLHQRWKYDEDGLIVEIEDLLNGGKTTIARDGLGNPRVVTDAIGNRTTNRFNALGQVVREDMRLSGDMVDTGDNRVVIAQGPTSVWRRYDGLGRMTYAQNGTYADTRDTGVRFEYDGLDRITKETQIMDDSGQTLERTYAADNTWIDTRYPELTGSPKVRRHIDKLGRITRVDLDGDMEVSYAFSGSDRVAVQSYRNGILTTYAYDGQRRLTDAVTWGEAGPSGRDPAIIYRARTTFTPEGRIASMVTSDLETSTSSTTTYTYDRRGRVTESATTTSTAGPTPSTTESRLLTTFAGDRPSHQAELLVDIHGEKPAPIFARVLNFEYDGARVDAVTTTARNKFGSFFPTSRDELRDAGTLLDWIKGDGSFSDRQKYTYDDVGNLVADEANTYQYDTKRNLIRVIQIPGNRPYNQSTFFVYDPIGRRVQVAPHRDRAPSGFVNWQPWNKNPSWFLYDGTDAVAEVTGDLADGGQLLARYIPGGQPGERIRMDRRNDDDPSKPFTAYYLHAGVQGQIAFLTNSSGKMLGTSAPSASQASSFLSPPDELRFITGTKTRSPYLGGTTRIDGYAGVKYDEEAQRALYDYRTSTTLAEAIDMAAYRESITAMQNRGAVALGVMTMAAIAPFAAAFEGVLNVGLNWYASWRTDAPYTAGEAGEHFAEGVLSGGLGKLMPGGASAISKYAADFATDFTAGMAFDVGWKGRAFNDAVADNIVGAAASASLATGLRLGAAGVGMGMRHLKKPRTPDVHPEAQVAASRWGSRKVDDMGHYDKKNVTGDVFDSILRGKFRSLEDNAFQAEMLDLLLNGRSFHRFIGRMILSGKLTVHWHAGLRHDASGVTFGAHSSFDAPTAVYLNPKAFAKNPSAALEAASTIVHEAVHAMGGGEIAAHLAQGSFLHHWSRVKKRKGATDMLSFAGEYTMGVHSHQLMGAFMLAEVQKTPVPMYKLIKRNGYKGGVSDWFFDLDRVARSKKFHRTIMVYGGWGKVLRLDPGLAAALEKHLSATGKFGY